MLPKYNHCWMNIWKKRKRKTINWNENTAKAFEACKGTAESGNDTTKSSQKSPFICPDCDISTEIIPAYVPKDLRKRLWKTSHGFLHPSGRATRKIIQKKYVWPNMTKDIQDWCRLCVECQKSKIGSQIRLPHEHIAVPDRRFENVHIGPLRPSKEFTYLLTAIDRFTRGSEAIPLAILRQKQ